MKMKKINTANWDKFSKRIVLGLVVAALVAAFFLLLGIYLVGAEARAGLATATNERVVAGNRAIAVARGRITEAGAADRAE